MPQITEVQFAQRFPSLILRAQGFPKKSLDRHVLLIGSVLALDPSREYTEPELNDELRRWTSRFGESVGLDHVTLRRYLIDERYLERDAAGTTYRLAATGAPYTYDPSIAALDLDELVSEAERERERRKRLYTQGTEQ